MQQKSNFKTEQESFWAGDFGDQYIDRNNGSKLMASNLAFFSKALNKASSISSVLELGANIGMNLRALKLLLPDANVKGLEINRNAAEILATVVGRENTIIDSIVDYQNAEKHDLVLIKGVLIHLNPDVLNNTYEKIYESSSKYILICEYYNPRPVEVDYRGHKGKLFKRDFAGEMLEKYEDLILIDYGFAYHRDNKFPQDDITWFLIEKR